MIGSGDGWSLAAQLTGWALAVAWLSRVLFHRAVRTHQVNGG
jgi:hypothetical protein